MRKMASWKTSWSPKGKLVGSGLNQDDGNGVGFYTLCSVADTPRPLFLKVQRLFVAAHTALRLHASYFGAEV